MKHGVLFENLDTGIVIHTLKDWGLIFAPREISPPTPKTSYLEIEGRDGSLDLTEALGGVKYNDREFSLEFTIVNRPYKELDELTSKIMNFIHGTRLKITIYSDPDYYYLGRCQVDKISINSNPKTISIKCKTEPYKYRQFITKKTFNIVLETGVTSKKIALYNEKKKVVPKVICDRNIDIKFGDTVYSFSEGENMNLNILLEPGENVFEILKAGTVTFEYQEASL